MRIGLVEFLLILAIASLTVGPQVALFVDRWMRRANRVNARAARRRAEYAAQMAAERDALLKRFRTASTVFGVGILLALVYALVFRPIDTPPQAYTAPEVRQSTGAVQTALSADSRDVLALGDYQGVDCIREQDGFVYAAAYNGATLKKRKSDLVRTDGGSFSAILSVDGELTGFAFDADGDLWLTVLTPGGGAPSIWVEKNADSTLLRGIALRAGQNLQEKLFGLPSDAPCAEAVSTADGSWKRAFIGGSSCTAVCPVGSKVYFGAADSAQVLSARI